jgi:hypothetical protein
MARFPLLSARDSGAFVQRVWGGLVENFERSFCISSHNLAGAGAPEPAAAEDDTPPQSEAVPCA